MAKSKVDKFFRTILLFLATLGCAVLYYLYIQQSYESAEFKDPAGKNTALYQKNKFIYDIFALPGKMTYYLLGPETMIDDIDYPLLVILHGGTGKAYAADYMAQDYYRQKYLGYVMVPVVPPGHVWGSPYVDPTPYKNALPYVAEIVKSLTANLPIDNGRVYIVGCSMGGGGAIVSSLYYQDTYAAAAAIAGFFVPDYFPAKPETPLWILQGDMDLDVPVEAARATATAIKKQGGPVYYTEYEGWGHNCPSPAFYPDELWDWLYSQSKPALRTL